MWRSGENFVILQSKSSKAVVMANININVSEVGGKSSGITRFCCADKGLGLFERQYPLSDGMSYDSYIIEDEKLVVVDTVDDAVAKEWFSSLDNFFAQRVGQQPYYLIVQHLEPDHSAAIGEFMEKYPACQLICSAKAKGMLPSFVPGIDVSRVTAVKEGERICIGDRELQFFMAPMVHWPEVMVTYDARERLLFSADAFGTFGCGIASMDSSEPGFGDSWRDEARRYYINICGKYGSQVQALLRKSAGLDIRYICPLHGPVIDVESFNPFPLYDIWSRYQVEFPRRCVVVVSSLHGYTVEAGRRLAVMLEENGVQPLFFDLSEADLSEVVSQAFASGATIFMSSTYDASLVPSMRELLGRLKSKGWQNRVAGIVENGSWAPIAAKLIGAELGQMKEIEVLEPVVTIRTRLTDATETELRGLADAIASSLLESDNKTVSDE